jgi:RHS repeat-associated protein
MLHPRWKRWCSAAVLAAAAAMAAPAEAAACGPAPDAPCAGRWAAPTISITPGTSTLTSPVQTITVTWSSDRGMRRDSSRVMLNGANVTSQFKITEGFVSGVLRTVTATGTLTLRPGPHTFTATTMDVDGVRTTSTAQYTNTNFVDATFHNGENLNTALYAARLSYATPAYISKDRPRSVQLFWSSAQARPLPLVQVEVTDTSPSPPEALSIRLNHGSYRANAPVTFPDGSQESFYLTGEGGRASGSHRLAAQFDASDLATGAYTMTVTVRKWRAGAVYAENSVPVRVLVVNERDSKLGSGWTVAGLQRLVVQSDGVMVTAGNGVASFYRRRCTGCDEFLSPAGESATLTYIASQSRYRLEAADHQSYVSFNASGQMIYSGDPWVETTAYAYDTAGRLSTITDGAQKVITFGYDAAGFLSGITDPAGRRAAVSVSGGLLVSVTDPDNVVALRPTYATTGTRLITSWLDRGGFARDFGYDFAGGLASITLPQVSVRGAPARPVTRTSSLESVVLPAPGTGTTLATPAMRIKPNSVRLRSWDAAGTLSTVTPDRLGQALRLDAPLSRVALMPRNEQSRVTRAVSITGDTTDIEYDESGLNPVRITDRRTGRVITHTYRDGRIEKTTGGAQEVSHEYELIRDYQGQWTGQLGRLIVTTAGSEKTAYEGGVARPAAIYGPGSETRFSYEAGGFRNTKAVSRSGGSRVDYTYDAYGRVATSTDTRGDTTRYEYDLMNRPTRIVHPDGGVVTYGYDNLFRTTVTDPRSQVYRTERNALGWATRVTDPRGKFQTFEHDSVGNVVAVTNRRGQTVRYTYDVTGKVLTRDADGKRTTYAYDPAGGFIAFSNAESTDTLYAGRDGSQRQVTIRPVPALRGGTQRIELSSAFDADGLRTSLTETSGPQPGYSVTYDYQRGNKTFRPTQVSLYTGCRFYCRGSTSTEYLDAQQAARMVNTARDTVTRSRFGVRFHDSALSRLSLEYARDRDGRTVVQSGADTAHAYTFDSMGRLSGVNDQVRKYREAYRDVCEADRDGREYCWQEPYTEEYWEPGQSLSYLWDAVGNPSPGWFGFGPTVETGNRLTANMGLLGLAMEYDDDGNMTRKRNALDPSVFDQRFFWSSLGELDSVRTTRQGVTQTVSFGYDGLGRRVRKTGAAGITRYVWDDEHVAMELDGNGDRTAYYSYYPGTDQPHAMVRGWDAYFYLADAAGNVVGMTDSTGVLVSEYRYDPFGKTLTLQDGVPNPLRFAGREYDAETGLYYFRARYYDPELGRFASEDPTGLSGGANPYVYAANDPVNHSDPSGLECYAVWLNGVLVGTTGTCELAPLVVTADRDPGWNWPDWLHDFSFDNGCGDVCGIITDSEFYDWLRERAAQDDWNHFRDRVDEAGRSLKSAGTAVVAAGGTLLAAQWALAKSELAIGHTAVVTTGVLLEKAAEKLPAVRMPQLGERTIVLGESMERVRAAALRFGSETYEPMKEGWMKVWDDGVGMMLNIDWLEEKIRAGYNVVDIGIDRARSDVERSPFYATEQQVMDFLTNEGVRFERYRIWWPESNRSAP